MHITEWSSTKMTLSGLPYVQMYLYVYVIHVVHVLIHVDLPDLDL